MYICMYVCMNAYVDFEITHTFTCISPCTLLHGDIFVPHFSA